MGVPSNKPMICGHCDEADLKKLVTKHGKHQRICRKCKYAQKLKNHELQNNGAFDLLEIDAFCMNGCKWSRKVEYEQGTKPDTRVLCPSCQGLTQGTIENAGLANHWSFCS